MAELNVGDPAPNIELLDERGEPFRLADLRGKKVVLYFYPRASTPGCTSESCQFRDTSDRFSGRNTVIIGISPDKPAAQQKFKTNQKLPFTLLADVEKVAATAYGVWGEKKFMGRKFMGVERSTFVIGADGRIEKIFRKVKVSGHAEEVLASLS